MSIATAITRTDTRIRVGLVIFLVASFLATLVPTPAEAAVDGSAESQFVALLNQERAARGLPKLAVASDLVSVARKHSARMAASNDLHHNPNLGSDVSGWQKVGENVGRGPSVGTIHDAFMNSSGHRANILDGDWTEVGVGVEVVDGRVWVTEVFRKPASAAAPAEEPKKEASAPAPKKTSEPAESSDAPAAAPAQDDATDGGSGTQQGSGPEEGSPDPAPLPALDDRTMAVLVLVESEESGS